jgi:hypothetical protein
MSETPAIIASGLPGKREDAHRAGITIAARMDESDSSNQREELRRLSIAIVIGFLFVAAFTHLQSVYAHKFHDVTGRARWIWPRVEMSSEIPVAFFATRDFDLPANRYYTHIKIAADPEYTLYFNGREIASRRATDASGLDVYDVGALSRDGRNRIVVAVRSVKGAGGLLATVDIAPEVENFVITDRGWKVSRVWSPELLLRDVASSETPSEVGEPPVGRWNYLQPRTAEIASEAKSIAAPLGVFAAKTSLPEVKVVGGTAIGSTRRVRAWGYEFGWIDGRARVTRDRDVNLGQVIEIRYANAPDEVLMVEGKTQPLVFAPGESSVTDPEVRHFRYIGVYGRPARADVVRK